MKLKLIQRADVYEGVAWSSKKHWFWLSFGGHIYSFTLKLGRLDIAFEKKN